MTTIISKDRKPNPPTSLENSLETMKKPETLEKPEPKVYAGPTQPTPEKPQPAVCTIPTLPSPTPGSASSTSTRLADEKEPVLSFSLPTLSSSLTGDSKRGSSIYRRSD